MAFERAAVRTSYKPWGSRDLRPWNSASSTQAAIGELLFDRAESQSEPLSPDPSLLLKLLFTKEDLSIQVHPDDVMAQWMGMPNGKTEAWYVLSAEAGAHVAVGLKRSMTKTELADAITDGSIVDRVKWQAAAFGDVFFVQAGTIHAIGAGLTIAEIQQRSDTTFRLFDQGRSRELHVDQALSAANLEPAKARPVPIHLTDERIKLVSCPFFVLERIDLPMDSQWEMCTGCETWALVLGGEATIGSMRARVGDVFFAEADRAPVNVGRNGVTVLVAYAGSAPAPNLLRELDDGTMKDGDVSDEKSPVRRFPSAEGHL